MRHGYVLAAALLLAGCGDERHYHRTIAGPTPLCAEGFWRTFDNMAWQTAGEFVNVGGPNEPVYLAPGRSVTRCVLPGGEWERRDAPRPCHEQSLVCQG